MYATTMQPLNVQNPFLPRRYFWVTRVKENGLKGFLAFFELGCSLTAPLLWESHAFKLGHLHPCRHQRPSAPSATRRLPSPAPFAPRCARRSCLQTAPILQVMFRRKEIWGRFCWGYGGVCKVVEYASPVSAPSNRFLTFILPAFAGTSRHAVFESARCLM